MFYAAFRGETEVVMVLIEAGAEVNAKDNDDKTPLDYTKLRGKYPSGRPWPDPKKHDECAKLLRKHGAKTGAELAAEAKQGKAER